MTNADAEVGTADVGMADMGMADMGTADVLVAGAGIAGSALAYALSRRGVDVMLVERGPSGAAGASTVPTALINPHRGRSGRAKPQDAAGASAFWDLVADLETQVGPSGAHRTGVLRLADNARQARVWQKLDGTEWLEAGAVPPGYHAPFGAMLVPGGGWLRSEALLAALIAGTRAGASMTVTGVELVGVEQAGSVAAGTTAILRGTKPGAATYKVHCHAVVVATGAWQPQNMRLPRLELVWGEARTFELGFTPSLPLAGGVVAAFEDGLATVTGGHRHAGWLGQPADPRPRAEPTPDLLRALAWHVPGAAGANEIGSWEGVRAKRPSGEPVVRRIAPGVHLMAGFGGRGFLRAASAARKLADELAAQLR